VIVYVVATRRRKLKTMTPAATMTATRTPSPTPSMRYATTPRTMAAMMPHAWYANEPRQEG
jgi:hypothetical protein